MYNSRNDRLNLNTLQRCIDEMQTPPLPQSVNLWNLRIRLEHVKRVRTFDADTFTITRVPLLPPSDNIAHPAQTRLRYHSHVSVSHSVVFVSALFRRTSTDLDSRHRSTQVRGDNTRVRLSLSSVDPAPSVHSAGKNTHHAVMIHTADFLFFF